MKRLLIVLAAGAVLFTACGSTTETDPISTDPIEDVGSPAIEVPEFVDFYEQQNPGTIADFCAYADQLGVDAARDAFVTGFTSEYPDDDYADAVFDELVSRC